MGVSAVFYRISEAAKGNALRPQAVKAAGIRKATAITCHFLNNILER